MKAIFSVLVFVSIAYYQSGTAIGQPVSQREQGQANQQATVSPAPTPTIQPTIEKIEPKPTGNETENGHSITIVDERSPWPAWIANGISALVLIFLAFQTVWNRGVLESMKKSERFLESQCTALTKQTDILEESYRINSRAYVFISEATLKSPISSGEFPEPKVVIANSGQTPAYRYRVRFEQAFLSGEDNENALNGIMPAMRPLGEQGHALGSGEFSTNAALIQNEHGQARKNAKRQ